MVNGVILQGLLQFIHCFTATAAATEKATGASVVCAHVNSVFRITTDTN